ncbi:hypothetical protein M3Y97_00626900 [Aphelenchoides bicaudatus]|nr:hypothetical protein M3Y97_00626900 [Aphelenchoides bicaudatus]
MDIYLLPTDFEFGSPQNRLSFQFACDGCKKILDLAKNKLPNVGQLTKDGLTSAVKKACQLYYKNQMIKRKLCETTAGLMAGQLAGRVIPDTGDPKKIDPEKNCKLLKLCSDC